MTKFVEVEHEGIKVPATVPESSLKHYAKAGWKPVTAEQPSADWTRKEIDAFAAELGIDTSGAENKAAAIAAIAAQQNTDTEES